MVTLISEKVDFISQFIPREKKGLFNNEKLIHFFEDKCGHGCGSVMSTYAEHRRPWVGFQVWKKEKQLSKSQTLHCAPDNTDAKHRE